MKKFYNRKKELRLLSQHYELSKNNLITDVIIGRRRIGKTELVRKHIKNKKSLYFYATKKSPQIILNDFTEILREIYPATPSRLTSFEDLFKIIFEFSVKNNLTVVLDEFQNFHHIDASVYSVLQKIIDEYKDKAKMHLIFIGSVQTLMRKIFMEKEPLYGRVDNVINLESFAYDDIIKIARDHQLVKQKDIFSLYGIFGGVAKYYDYLEKFNLFKKPLPFILTELVFDKNAPLYKEGENILIEEFGSDYERYFDILYSLSIGKTKLNEIANLMQLPITTIGKYMNVLVHKYTLVEKRNFQNKKLGRNNRYYINDIFLRFWFRYVYRNFSKIELGAQNIVTKEFQKTFSTQQGFVFEELVRKLLLKKIFSEEKLGGEIDFISNYWDKKQKLDIYGKKGENLIIGEIKLNEKAIDEKIISKIEKFAQEKNPNGITDKVIVTFDKIKNEKIRQILKKKNITCFVVDGLLFNLKNRLEMME